METSCGKVSAEERNEIRQLFHRKMALTELFQAIGKMDPKQIDALYEKALLDMGETSAKFQAWWDAAAKRHGWKAINGANWRIDFDTCEVFLVHQ
jgi:CXXX repeat modification system protein